MRAVSLALVALLVFAACGCEQPKAKGPYKNLGVVLDASVIPVAFNQCPKMQIRTERAVVVVLELHEVALGDTAWMSSDGFLFVGNNKHGWVAW